MERPLALLVDGGDDVLTLVRSALAERGIDTVAAATEGEGLDLLTTRPIRVILLACPRWSPERRDFLARAARLRPSVVTVALLDPSSRPDECEAYRSGAPALLSRPRDPGCLGIVVERAVAQHDLLEEHRRLREGLDHRGGFDPTTARNGATQRLEELERLTTRWVEEIRAINNLPPIRFEPGAMEALAQRTSRGDVQDLRDVIGRWVLLASDGTLRAGDLPEAFRFVGKSEDDRGPAAASFRDAKREVVESFEKDFLEDLLARNRGNVTAAALEAGMLRSALQRLLRKHHLRSSDFRGPRGEPPRP